MSIRKNDQVVVLGGKDKGKRGKVLRVFPERSRVVVERVNFIKRHTRANPTTGKGGIVEKEAPLHDSNVAVICGRCDTGVRVGRRGLEDGRRVRYCKRCGEDLDT